MLVEERRLESRVRVVRADTHRRQAVGNGPPDREHLGLAGRDLDDEGVRPRADAVRNRDRFRQEDRRGERLPAALENDPGMKRAGVRWEGDRPVDRPVGPRPGESDGTCNGGPSAGTFWPAYAAGIAHAIGW